MNHFKTALAGWVIGVAAAAVAPAKAGVMQGDPLIGLETGNTRAPIAVTNNAAGATYDFLVLDTGVPQLLYALPHVQGQYASLDSLMSSGKINYQISSTGNVHNLWESVNQADGTQLLHHDDDGYDAFTTGKTMRGVLIIDKSLFDKDGNGTPDYELVLTNIPRQNIATGYDFGSSIYPGGDGFQYQIIPEPASLALLGLGAGAMLARRRKQVASK